MLGPDDARFPTNRTTVRYHERPLALGEPVRGARFPVPQVLPQDLEFDPAYPAAVREARPWGYWRLERVTEERVPNEVAGGPGLQLLGGVRLGGAPGRNHWATFQSDGPRQAILMDGSWTPPRRGYALELWFQADAVGQNALVSLLEQNPDALVKVLADWLEQPDRQRKAA